MCDTMLVMGGLTDSGRTIFAKNSDREPNEAQYLERVPARDHAPGSVLRTTYVEIPQVARTHAHIGSRPWWMWGYEHGVNEHGLAIGNEAVWSRLPAGTEPGLLGMDLLRLTLERARDADEALAVLTALIETHGQSGRASTHRDMFYHNAFILADAQNAWVLETAGRHWVAKRVQGWASISNVYSIGTDYDLISAQAEGFAVSQGWHRAGEAFDWAAAYTDQTRPNLPYCRARLAMSRRGLAQATGAGKVTLADMFAALRDHGDVAADWRPGVDGQGMICMHAPAAETGSETAASMVAELAPGRDPQIWASLASPCLSAFLPVWIDSGAPQGWSQPAPGAPDAWWAMEYLQRLVERDYATAAPPVRAAMDAIETEAMAAPDAPDRAALTNALAERQAGAVTALTAMLAALQSGVLAPRPGDPRGTYLAETARLAPDTTCISEDHHAPA